MIVATKLRWIDSLQLIICLITLSQGLLMRSEMCIKPEARDIWRMPTVQASFEPVWLQKGPLVPKEWAEVLSDMRSLLTRVGTLGLLVEGDCLIKSVIRKRYVYDFFATEMEVGTYKTQPSIWSSITVYKPYCLNLPLEHLMNGLLITVSTPYPNAGSKSTSNSAWKLNQTKTNLATSVSILAA